MSSPSTSRAQPSRKSLSAVASSIKHHANTRKRAKSMASTNPDELTPRSKRRRSLAPKKSILKQSNAIPAFPLVNALSSSQIEPPRSSQPLEDITMNFTRVSALNQDRRVSFAPNAHVRLIPKESQHTNGSDTPPSSPRDSLTDSPSTSQDNTRPDTDSSPIKSKPSPRRSSLRQSTGGDGEGEASMDLASDASYLDEEDSAGEPSTPQKPRESLAGSEGSSMDLDDSQDVDDMDMTMNTNVSGRPSLAPSARPRRSSTKPRRESTAQRETDPGMKLKEFTISLEQSLVQPSANWLALQAIMNHHPNEPNSPPPNIDLETAAARILLAGHDIPVPVNDDEEADTTISSEGHSEGDIGEKTMDFTALSGGLGMGRLSMRGGDMTTPFPKASIAAAMGDVTTAFPRVSLRDITSSFPRGSLKLPSAPPASRAEEASSGDMTTPFPRTSLKPSVAEPSIKLSSIPIPTSTPGNSMFKPKPPSFAPTPRAVSSSPIKAAESTPSKQPRKPNFSAAFAPPTSTGKGKAGLFTVTVPSSIVPKSPVPTRQTPQKRTHPVDESTAVTDSPAKKLIVVVDGDDQGTKGQQAKAMAIPKARVQVQASPSKGAASAQSQQSSPVKKAAAPPVSAPAASPAKKSAPKRPSDYLTRPSLRRMSAARGILPPGSSTVATSSSDAPAFNSTPVKSSAAPLSITPVKSSTVASTSATPIKPSTCLEAPKTPVTETPKSPGISHHPSPRVLAPILECERETSLQQDAEPRLASSPRVHSVSPIRRVTTPRESSPVRTPAVRRSFVGTPMHTSPWMPRTSRASIAPALRTAEEGDEEDEEGEEAVNVLDLLSEETRARLPQSVDELLRLVGGEFMDNMVVRRRSTMAVRNTDQYPDAPITAADYAIAMAVDFPQLAYYDYVSRHLDAQVDQLDKKQKETDEIIQVDPPPCFVSYAEDGDNVVPELKETLESIRSLVRQRTKKQWYEWRLEDVSNMHRNVDKREKAALVDLSNTQIHAAQLGPTLNVLEVQHAEIMAELERERAVVKEIEKCDPKALAEVKSSIADQATALMMLEEEMADIQKEIDRDDKRAATYKAERKTLEHKIEHAERACRNANPNKDTVAELKGEIKIWERMSRWKALKVSPSRVCLEYDGWFLVNIPCKKWTPLFESCDIRVKETVPFSKPREDFLPLWTKFTLEAARERLVKGRFGKLSVRKIMDKLTTFWTCCDVVRHEIMMLRSKYAVKLRYDDPGKDFVVEVPILFEKSSSKVVVEFDFNTKVVQTWPLTVPKLQPRLRLGYVLDDNVTINVETLSTALNDRLKEATMAENFGILLDACVDVDALYP